MARGGMTLRKDCSYEKAKYFWCGCTRFKTRMIRKWNKQEINSLQEKLWLQVENVRMETSSGRKQRDTGSDVAIINKKTWEQMGEPKLCSLNKMAYSDTKKKITYPVGCNAI